ncbi:polyphosphate kinase 2 family protein [Leucothrix sargassi]|nr:polyphosphate kinase 2 family protein [Leucothrix sargassi]
MPNKYKVPSNGEFDFNDLPTAPEGDVEDSKSLKKQLKKEVAAISELQRQLYAEDKRSLLLVFQAMDAAGKDSTIRAVLTGVNPAGFQVYSFKQPSKEELDHDFLWRTHCKMPERGRIGVFNRSYYEEVLVIKVHPEYLAGQRLKIPEGGADEFWQGRYDSINNAEKHLVKNGTKVVKFFLNVSKEEQKQRFLSRIEEKDKNWKFSHSDLQSRALWDNYQQAYHDLLNETSTDIAPWHAIPADNKPYMRLQVAKIVRATLEEMKPEYPTVSKKNLARLEEAKKSLLSE